MSIIDPVTGPNRDTKNLPFVEAGDLAYVIEMGDAAYKRGVVCDPRQDRALRAFVGQRDRRSWRLFLSCWRFGWSARKEILERLEQIAQRPALMNDEDWQRLQKSPRFQAVMEAMKTPDARGYIDLSQANRLDDFGMDENAQCAECGGRLEIVRPGKYQCPACEARGPETAEGAKG